MADITEELRVLVTAEVDKAIKNLKQVDKQTNETERIFKSLGGTITSALSIKALADFASKSEEAYRQQKEAVSVLESVIKSVGATAWTSAEQLEEMASGFQKITNYGDEAILSMQSVLLGFRNIKGDQFKSATKAILDMSTVMKMDLKSAAQVVGKALDDPINGLDSLKRQGFAFTDSQKAMIKSMLEVGDVAGAQKIILDELENTYGGAAEAAADMGTQIKNSLGDLLEGYGKLFATLGNGTGVLENFKDGIDYVSDALWNFDEYFAKAAGGDKYKAWYESLSDTRKLEEAQKQLTAAREKYQQAVEKGNKKEIDEEIKVIDIWQRQVRLMSDIVSQNQRIQAEENARRDAENEINELMYSIAQNYEKLSKDDPTKQLEAYKKQLVDIGEERKKLSESNATDKDGNIIDTEAAVKQLDYIEKKIWEKIRKIQSDGKKSWQKWFSEITQVDENDFSNGADAAQKYLDQIEGEFKQSKSVSEMLGDKFDLKEALEKEQGKIKDTLEKLFAIDTSKIDESFTTQDESVQKLIEKYKELGEEIRKNTTEPVQDWDTWLGEKIDNVILKLDGLDEKTAKVVASMSLKLSNISLDATMTGFEEFGRALGEGEDAADSMSAALAAMAQQILKQLPMLFLQAGLQLIATPGMWPLGLGLIAAAGSSAIIAGYVDGKQSSAKESAKANALGGVYGADDYSAFAKGGTFTNSIVQSPTFFKFAKGSGFGTGLMGEAGPEAIMPLTRGADGSLGVSASGIGGDYSLTVVINNYGNEEVSATESTTEDGKRKLEITIGAIINKHLSDGSADRALKSRYGIKAQGV